MFKSKTRTCCQTDIFDGDDLDFEDFLATGAFLCYEQYELDSLKTGEGTDCADIDDRASRPPYDISHATAVSESIMQDRPGEQARDIEEPTRLENGRWACNHKCKDKTT